MSFHQRIDRGLRPIGDVLEQILGTIALRTLRHHWSRAEDRSLTQAERAEAEANAAGIIDACRRHGLLTVGDRHV